MLKNYLSKYSSLWRRIFTIADNLVNADDIVIVYPKDYLKEDEKEKFLIYCFSKNFIYVLNSDTNSDESLIRILKSCDITELLVKIGKRDEVELTIKFDKEEIKLSNVSDADLSWKYDMSKVIVQIAQIYTR